MSLNASRLVWLKGIFVCENKFNPVIAMKTYYGQYNLYRGNNLSVPYSFRVEIYDHRAGDHGIEQVGKVWSCSWELTFQSTKKKQRVAWEWHGLLDLQNQATGKELTVNDRDFWSIQPSNELHQDQIFKHISLCGPFSFKPPPQVFRVALFCG